MRLAAIRGIAVLAIGVCLTGVAAAQTSARALAGCSGEDLRGFTIRDARLEDPFWMLRWRKPGLAVQNAIAALKGKPYSFAAVNTVSTLIESQTWLPDNPNSIAAIHYSDIGVEDCRSLQLDVVFRIFSAAPSATLSSVFEWGSKDKTTGDVAGLTRTSDWQVVPEAGFDEARGFSGGGRVHGTWSRGNFPFGTLAVQATGSSESHAVSAAIDGTYESLTSWLQRANWRLVYDDSSMPASSGDDGHLGERRVAAQFAAASRPLKGVVARVGGILNGGQLRSGFAASELPAQTVPDSDFTASTLVAGVTGRQHQQAFTASYALTFGSTTGGFHGDWRKQVADVAHEFWLPVGNHRLFEFEQRLTLGRLHVLDVVPATERFFGGASDDILFADDHWRIQVGPRIRSMPTNQFALDGSGGDRFVAYNSTTAFTVWRKPVLPPELLREPDFTRAVSAAMTGARATLDAVYRSTDPFFQQILTSMPDAVARLERMKAVTAAARSATTLPAAAFEECNDAIHASRTAVDHAMTGKSAQAYGWVLELLPDGDNAIAAVVSTCGVDLVAALRKAGAPTSDLESASHDLETASSTIELRFAAIDDDKWAKKADADLEHARRALNVIMRQLNITSVSPVFVFDAARLGPAGDDPYGGNRYAIGGGLRLTVDSTVNMTVTYAVNPRRRADEGAGALVFALTLRDLFD
jgi:hypothetical protein